MSQARRDAHTATKNFGTLAPMSPCLLRASGEHAALPTLSGKPPEGRVPHFTPALRSFGRHRRKGNGCDGLSQNWAECFTWTQLVSSVALGKLYTPCASVFSCVNGDNNNTYPMELLCDGMSYSP